MTETVTKQQLKIESLDDLKRVLIIAKGGDPDAIQAVSNFMDLKSNTERSYFPDKITTLCIGQLNGFGKVYFSGEEWDPFSLVADVISVSFMGYKGFKSEQFKDMTSGQPNLDKLQGLPEETKKGILSGIFSRSGKE